MKRPDLKIIVPTLLLTALGMLIIYSTGGRHYLIRQLLFLPVALAGMFAAYAIPQRVFHDMAGLLYGVILLLLVLVLFFGKGIGSKRWFMLGPVAFQPSEFAKLATVLLLARSLASCRNPLFTWKTLFVPSIICLVPAILVITEPDLSAALVLAVILASMLYWAGFRPLHILLLFTPLISFAAGFSLYTWIPFFVFLGIIMLIRTNLFRTLLALLVGSLFGLLSPISFSLLKVYQRARIKNFLAPWLDPHGVGWNAIQSRIAIGSGRLTGKGFLSGTQTRLGFLPNRHTDFAFSCVGEEFGFIGSILLVGLFALIIHRFLIAARFSRDSFSSLVGIGCAAILSYQVFINIGMLLGLIPITGVPLPFISYGGSSLVLNYIIVGLILNFATKPQ
ncbi:rod shape-determining protein RodA [candidate division WOR-3 bacterium JGI_Cruoil_03_51_56]|uniref:Rod shape-determining protein RodA n=1 Tax=candidate division WOR-3 bacterium JGI_Cruoil_03_51_56 TaxID=1973747 RepID=A0A235BPU5_UNCW3|nr:MAG: rod shape-determining protein RodA [candidate division WOR-3 bacterium JGI_Cruoil_03_51_56]